MDTETRLNTAERELLRLEKKMDTQFELFRKDLDRIFDGTKEQPGVLRKLDRLDEIAELLRDRLPIKDDSST